MTDALDLPNAVSHPIRLTEKPARDGVDLVERRLRGQDVAALISEDPAVAPMCGLPQRSRVNIELRHEEPGRNPASPIERLDKLRHKPADGRTAFP